MKSITENFTIIIEKQKKIGYYFPEILHPPATTQQIVEAEKMLGLKFSGELVELYSFANGTSRDDNPLGIIGLIPIFMFASLEEAVQHYKINIQFEESFVEWDTNYKPGNKLFPILQNGSGDFYWVDLNLGTENYGKIYFTNTLPHSPGYTFNSLTAMFETIEECYNSNVIFLDEENYLEDDGTKWAEVCKKNNPNLKYWDDYLGSIS
jgi:hypothetical protein